MFEKNISKEITKDIALINNQLNAVKLKTNMKKFIEKNIFFINSNLKDLLSIKKIGSYAIDQIYNFDNEPVIDLLGVKYVSKEMYNVYSNELETRDHFSDCWMCELNSEIYSRLEKLYEGQEHVKVLWNKKEYQLSSDKIIFKDSICVQFYKNNKLLMTISIRSSICSKDFPPIICDEKTYRRSFSIVMVKYYKVLNNLLNKKLELLFLYIRLQYRKDYTRKQRMYMKIKIMSDIMFELSKNFNLQIWTSEVFEHYLPNEKVIDNLFSNGNYYYVENKIFKAIHDSFRLKNLKWVFNKTYNDIKEFLTFYLSYATENSNLEKDSREEVRIPFIYDTSVYLKNELGSSNFTIKKTDKLYDDLDIKITTRNVYPSNKDIGVFLLFVNYFNFEIYYIEPLETVLTKEEDNDEIEKTHETFELSD